uniref:Caspase n=1 Tax=Pithovirus LCPAC103 TaxID=2506588 RepID=A0A481Z3R5_9VIRU|nr:MAG: caspase [Pithovirus LCPAC103]
MKQALLIGINYIGTRGELRGCINDIQNVHDMLLSRSYSEHNITVLTDLTEEKPTRANIIHHFKKLIYNSASQLYFHYAGHGSQIRDTDGDEEDGLDECLIPVDYKSAGVIVDDELKEILMLLRADQKLFAVMDCCHSGTGLDLRYNLYVRVGGSDLVLVQNKRVAATLGQCVLLSGCQDSQTSADAYIDDKSQGAMTYAFLEALPEAKNLVALMASIKKTLKEKGYSQVPNLSTGTRMSLKAKLDI